MSIVSKRSLDIPCRGIQFTTLIEKKAKAKKKRDLYVTHNCHYDEINPINIPLHIFIYIIINKFTKIPYTNLLTAQTLQF